MAQKLKITPLGGLQEIGKNLYVYECGGEILVVDCGMAFPDEDMLGVDIVLPDISYLVKNKKRISAIVITHGHEDHIGALPYVLKEINVPVYATPLALGLIRNKLDEAGILSNSRLHAIQAGSVMKIGIFRVEAISENHSTPDSVAYAITTPVGTVIHTGDFKIDSNPVEGPMIDLGRFGEYGEQGVLALLSDSTNAERPGYTMSESTVGETFNRLFKGSKERLIVTTFASNVHRIQQIIEVAIKHGRRVAISGRSIENILNLAVRLGYVSIPDGTLIDMTRINSIPKSKLVIITTGSQGETLSALSRMAFGTHRQVEIGKGDKIIVSASPIPGNEKTVSKVINELMLKGAEVVYESLSALHVSGHACREELKIMLGLTKPEFFIPIHGEVKHMRAHSNLALEMGFPQKNILLGENGRTIEFTKKTAKFGGRVSTGHVLIDGGIGSDVGTMVLRDRQMLAENGIILAIMSLEKSSGLIVSGPEIITRGFVYSRELGNIIAEMTSTAAKAAEASDKSDIPAMRAAVKKSLSDLIYKKSRCRPMILPIIMEV